MDEGRTERQAREIASLRRRQTPYHASVMRYRSIAAATRGLELRGALRGRCSKNTSKYTRFNHYVSMQFAIKPFAAFTSLLFVLKDDLLVFEAS